MQVLPKFKSDYKVLDKDKGAVIVSITPVGPMIDTDGKTIAQLRIVKYDHKGFIQFCQNPNGHKIALVHHVPKGKDGKEIKLQIPSTLIHGRADIPSKYIKQIEVVKNMTQEQLNAKLLKELQDLRAENKAMKAEMSKK